jgi:hypothetical protein
VQQSKRETHLAGCGARQELAQGDEVRVPILVDPASAHDEFIVKVSKVGDGTAERAHPQLQKGAEYLSKPCAWCWGEHGFVSRARARLMRQRTLQIRGVGHAISAAHFRLGVNPH